MTQSTRDIIRESAERNFAGHQLEVLHESGLLRHYRCGSPNRNAYAFWVTTIPGYLFLTGDLGTTVLRRESDMLQWLPRALRDPHYLMSKVVRGIETEEFDPECAAQWVKEVAAEGHRKLSPALAEALASAAFEDGEGAFRDGLEEAGIHGADQPECMQPNATFWWHYECLKWFARAANLKGD